MSRTSLKPAKRVRPAVSKPVPTAAAAYPRPPDVDGDKVTREARAEYTAAWKRLTRKPKAKEPAHDSPR